MDELLALFFMVQSNPYKAATELLNINFIFY